MTTVLRPTADALSRDPYAALPSLLFRHQSWLSPAPRAMADSGWMEHIPFGMYLVDAIEPQVLVELGTHSGCSYSALCQAIAQRSLATKAYAVDTWSGDQHSGLYGPDILRDFKRFHDTRYASFSSLLQMTFDQAAERIEDGTVDLLHIDGCHSYEAVKHDFETWRPKLSARGVVLFHDTQVREAGFGVFRYWPEISEAFPSFEFIHGHGLGVLAVGDELPGPVRLLTEADHETTAMVRNFFFQLGQRVSLEAKLADVQSDNSNLKAQLKNAIRDGETIDMLRALLTREQRALRELGSHLQQLATVQAELAELRDSATFKVAAKAWRVKESMLRIPGSRVALDLLQKKLRGLL